MGMFDRVWSKCPNCGNNIEFQSKAGDCSLHDYNLDTVPATVLGDLDGEIEICTNCDASVRISVHTSAVVSII